MWRASPDEACWRPLARWRRPAAAGARDTVPAADIGLWQLSLVALGDAAATPDAATRTGHPIGETARRRLLAIPTGTGWSVGLPAGNPIGHNRIFALLLEAAETAKLTLAHADEAVIEATDPLTGTAYRYPLTRSRFERLLRDNDILGRVNRALRKALDGAAARGYPAEQITGVFLVGGSCLIPAVQDLVHLQFAPQIVHLDRPLEAVATGAAAIAGGRELFDHVQHDYTIRHVGRGEGGYEFEILVQAGTGYPTATPVKTLTIRAIRDSQRRLGLAIYERAHASVRDAGADLEIMFDTSGGARTVAISPQRRQERAMIWLNEDSPTFLEADPPARAGVDRFRLEFRIDQQKRLVVSAFDLHRMVYVLDHVPVVQLV